MKTLKQYRDEHASLKEKMKAATDMAQEENREFNDQELKNLEEWEARMTEIDGKIKFQEKLEARIADKHNGGEGEIRHKKLKEDEKDKVVKRYSFLKAISARSKGQNLTGVELEMHQEAEQEAKRNNFAIQGIGVPSMFFRQPGSEARDLTAGSATDFGNTIATDVGPMIDYLWPRMSVEALGADVMSGLSSNVSFPRETVVPTGTWEGENDENAKSNPKTDSVPLSPKRVGTYVDISKLLLIQSNVTNLDRRVRRSIEKSIGITVDEAAINGSGTNNQPLGILNTSGIGSVAGGTNGAAPNWANIVGLETAVSSANADLGTLAYLSTPGIRGKLKTTEKASNTAQFIWDNGALPGIPNRRRVIGEGQLNSYRALVSTLVPSNLTKGSGVDLHAILFGNWLDLMVAQFGGMDIVVDPITQARNNFLRIVVNSFWDVAVARPASFAAMKDAIAA